MYKVSAIISTYKSESYLEGCLQDLLAQTLIPEIIVIANDPTEKELDILFDYEKYIKINIINRETIYASWNRAIKLSTGDYIFNANADDRHSKDYVELMSNELDKGFDLVYGEQYVSDIIQPFTNTGKKLQYANHSPELVSLGCYFGSSPMWRKDLHSTYGYFDESFESSGDWEFWNRINKCRIKKIDKILSMYYNNPNGMFNTSTKKYEEDNRIQSKYVPQNRKYNITACLIVRNEERDLLRCINSIKWLCNEIIILDTGSSDNTEMLMQSCNGVKYYQYSRFDKDNYLKDFSHARNECKSYATGDWILSIDADEFLHPESAFIIVDLLNRYDYGFYFTRILNVGSNVGYSRTARLFKNIKGLDWRNMIHETIEKTAKELGIKGEDGKFYIYHTGYSLTKEQQKEKSLRNLAIHYEQIYKEPENQEINSHIALICFNQEDYKQAVENAIISLVCKDTIPDNKARMCLVLFNIFNSNKSHWTAYEFLLQSLRFLPNQLMARWVLVDVYKAMKNYNEALKQLNFLKEFKEQKKESELNNDINLNLKIINEKIGEIKQCQQTLETKVQYEIKQEATA